MMKILGKGTKLTINDNPLGNWIRQEMYSRNMTLEEFAALAKVGKSTLSRLINYGIKRRVHVDTLLALERATHTPEGTLYRMIAGHPNATKAAQTDLILGKLLSLDPADQALAIEFISVLQHRQKLKNTG